MGAECSQVGACSGGGARPSWRAPQLSVPAPSSAAGIACRSSPIGLPLYWHAPHLCTRSLPSLLSPPPDPSAASARARRAAWVQAGAAARGGQGRARNYTESTVIRWG